ncbi:TRAP transporter small permease [Rhodococcus rhodnii]|uniref:Tripartite ATP-independent periplasmic transporters DctQ component domain-containing protein n=2 Tax=Rhodococcus rhodnii TaxID=38312 RepID=R7WH53_9NOCA|nr:TRAP transporter small permease [Rhodococcus rhodnii]EOM74406.1 hypothetical protein Rrhod_4208 [Rhodococcus rhodnii LMG 5362]
MTVTENITPTPRHERGRFDRVFAAIVFGCATVAGLTTVFMALHIAVDVTGRNLFNSPLPGTLEITQNWSMVIVVMLSMAYAERAGEHIGATLLTANLTGPTKWFSDVLVRAVALVMVAALTWYSIVAAVFATEVRQVALAAIAVPVWPVKIVLAVGFALFTVQILLSLVAVLRAGPGASKDSDGTAR